MEMGSKVMDELLAAYAEEWGHTPPSGTTDELILESIDGAASMCDIPKNYLLSLARVLLRAAMETEGHEAKGLESTLEDAVK